MRYPKLRELKEAIKALLKGPYTSKFPCQPHQPYERFRGRPYFHEEDCTGCAACAQVCPAKAIEVEDIIQDGQAKRKLTIHWDICIFCGQCQANCLTGKGIILSQEFAFATTENRQQLKDGVEKDFVLCDCCAQPIVPSAQYTWVAKRLGPLTFSNASLMLFYLKSFGLALKENISRRKEGDFLRSDRIKILCPRCRRQAVIKS
ncbi:MAG: 4Fe-4S dicluster domain-containing protein [Candidatus Omnitrophica bacterium]|nr:4Fe-4S dicluster domain-containing protein [Candidatus Omnitrophota bacterium]